MKNLLRITAIFNLLLVVSAYICVVIAAINKNVEFLIWSALIVIASIFPTAMMIALCNDFKDGKR